MTRGRLPGIAPPEQLIAEYERELLALLDAVDPGADARSDAADGGLLQAIARIFNKRAVARALVDKLRRRAAAGDEAVARAFRRQVDAYVRVRPRLARSATATVMQRFMGARALVAMQRRRDAWVAENVALVSSIGTQLHGELREVIDEAAKKGARHEVVAKQIEERFGVARTRARRIARDQVTKYAAQVNEAQQRAAGVHRYVWRHSGSTRNPRPEHLARDGEVFEWDRPPPDGHPGAAVHCRCTAEPVLEDVIGR